MARHRLRSRGFTLVELLVVISIIGMLMALLLPAVQAAREMGRRNTCQNNQHNISLAALQFAESKRYYPGWENNLNITSPTGTTMSVSYIVPLFPFLERNDVYQSLVASTSNYTTNTLVYMPILVCPSNPPTSQSGTPIAYVINGGQTTSTANTDVPTSNASLQLGYASASGIAYDLSQTSITAGLGVKVSQDYITSHDGSSNTLLLSENDITAYQTYLPPVGNQATSTTGAASTMTLPSGGGGLIKYGLVFMWGGVASSSATPPAIGQATAPTYIYGINSNKGTSTETLSAQYARPASNHPGCVVVAFCDGHVRVINDSVAYNVYKQLMSPYGVGTTDTDQGSYFPLNDNQF